MFVVVDGSSRKEYKSFTRFTKKELSKPGSFLLIAWWEGEGDFYVTNDPNVAVPELRQYYRDSYGVRELEITVISVK